MSPTGWCHITPHDPRRTMTRHLRWARGLLGALMLAAAVSTACASSAHAALGLFYRDVGTVRLSVDAVGTADASGTVEVAKPAGATVKRAFLFGATTPWQTFTPSDAAVTLDGTGVSWDGTRTA